MSNSFMSNEEALVSKSERDVFKKPLKRPPSKKRKVLDEETYLKKLGEIIERDFFPDIAEMASELQEDELHARNFLVDTTDSVRTGISCDLPSHNSPASFETPTMGHPLKKPLHHRSASIYNSSATSKNNQETTSMTIDEFMASFTSEDNESFEKLLQEQVKKLKLKYAWLYDAESKHKVHHTPNLALPSVDDQKQTKMLALTGKANKVDDTRPLSIENWNYETFNSVMFVPEGAPVSKTDAMAKAHVKKEEVCHQNTRFIENPFYTDSSTLEPASVFQTTMKDGKVGVDGKEVGATPQVNGYRFLRSPSPAPGVDCSPLMTWGQVEGTPLALEGGQTPLFREKQPFKTGYRMPKASRKDELLKKISEKLNQNQRSSKSAAFPSAKSLLRSPSVGMSGSSMFDQRSAMSPAAQRLLSNKIVKRKGFGSSLSASYTPSPRERSSSTPGLKKTPTPSRRSHAEGFTPTKNFTPDLTDNLLHLPSKRTPSRSSPINIRSKRKCAADFF